MKSQEVLLTNIKRLKKERRSESTSWIRISKIEKHNLESVLIIPDLT